MPDLNIIEAYYKQFINNRDNWIPENVFLLNLNFLYSLDLLHFIPQPHFHPALNPYHFYLAESTEKLTLFNDEFIVWITPEQNLSYTHVLIALQSPPGEPQLEMVIIASGIYNQMSLLMKVIEKCLEEIGENKVVLAKLNN